MFENQYDVVPREDLELVDILRRYSIVGDIISYRLCPRQYGYFKIRNLVPSAQGQLFFGEIIHNVLDKAHLHYRGNNNQTEGTLPTDEEIDQFFNIVSKALKSQGIRPLSGGLEERARKLIKLFIRKLGNLLFPRIKDTEHKLEMQSTSQNGIDYILHGIVDVLLHDAETDRDGNESVEIWDYKGSRIPEDCDLDNYVFQMHVYSHLFKEKNGYYPKQVILFFIGELDNDGNENLEASDLLERCIKRVNIDEQQIKIAMKLFEETVDIIEDELKKPYSEQWLPLEKQPPTNMCETCDLRWSCSNPNGTYRLSGL